VPLCPRGVERGILRRLPPKPGTGRLKAKPFRGEAIKPHLLSLPERRFDRGLVPALCGSVVLEQGALRV
jgi:hypothetical protein